MTTDLPPSDLHPDARLTSSRRKIRAPFVLDDSMRFYSPQTNVEALEHPRVRALTERVRDEWTPAPVPTAGSGTRLALLVPCTKYKPYVTSREHRGINGALLAAGWRPVRGYDGPVALLSVLDPGEDPDVLNTAPLERDGVVLDRFVISEPLALVPYELTMYVDGEQSPATSYDDPGLFEARGTSISPERPDCTATQRADGTWAWGPAERSAYVAMHNAMADTLSTALGRLSPHYRAIVSWVAPGLTHRSFLADAATRRTDSIPSTRMGLDGRAMALRGVLDALPGAVEILPTKEQQGMAREQLATRLAAEGRASGPGSVRAVYARGDGHDTPLGLPELTAMLVERLDRLVAATASEPGAA
ncbi:hypothetical protein [Nocardioides houyundeii]|uniref:hypothetical protein n=1 Tax=Nocardioides houyundeii TaxID=2045452 RepID=UPI000DF3E74C|nr:hypothetical protein [Nocardioides houyundeii]